VTLRKRKIMREMRYKNRTYKLKKRGKVHLKKREKNIQNIKKKTSNVFFPSSFFSSRKLASPFSSSYQSASPASLTYLTILKSALDVPSSSFFFMVRDFNETFHVTDKSNSYINAKGS
jgi:hypothetical protein